MTALVGAGGIFTTPRVASASIRLCAIVNAVSDQRSDIAESRGLWLSRHFHEDAFERTRQRLADTPEAMKRRMGGGRFSCWGLSGVAAEPGLHVLAHNLQRIINLKGGNWTIAALMAA